MISVLSMKIRKRKNLICLALDQLEIFSKIFFKKTQHLLIKKYNHQTPNR